jgi:hypothetical protein
LELQKNLDSLIAMQTTFAATPGDSDVATPRRRPPSPVQQRSRSPLHKEKAQESLFASEGARRERDQKKGREAMASLNNDAKAQWEKRRASAPSPNRSASPPLANRSRNEHSNRSASPPPASPRSPAMPPEQFAASESRGGERIQVICRVRPARAESGRCVAVSETDPTLVTLLAQPPIPFKFDYVAGEASSQEEVFARVGKPLAQAVIRGYNATCFAYGQTGSGKVGLCSPWVCTIVGRLVPSHATPPGRRTPCLAG